MDRTAWIARLHRASGLGARHWALTQARLYPDAGAATAELGGGVLVAGGRYAGPNVSRAFALGLQGEVPAAQLAAVEAFFEARGLPVRTELSPFAHDSLRAQLIARGHHPLRFEQLCGARIEALAPAALPAGVVVVPTTDQGLFERIARAAYELGGADAELSGPRHAPFFAPPAQSFLCRVDGQPVGVGVAVLVEGVAVLLAGAVVPGARGRGLQRALLQARIEWARARGATDVVSLAAPGGASEANLRAVGLALLGSCVLFTR